MKRIRWTVEKLQEEALKYKARGDFKKNNQAAYMSAWRKGILDQICSHMIDSRTEAYTFEELCLEALKYNTRSEFQEKNGGAYAAARIRGILDQICGHMDYICYPWTNEELRLEVLKYKTRKEFNENNRGAYQAALRRNILDEICKHMPLHDSDSCAELELFNIVKEYFSSARKFRDYKVKIEGKPHIKRFDIDIFIPEFNLGIEFDGFYWHSPKGLRRSRKFWPEEDLRNYHEIKDNWFVSSKGIKILHIKEKDWNKNKQTCIDQCLEFLGIKVKAA
jgi:hypothetical protein